MEHFVASIVRNAWVVVAGLLAVGAGLALLGASLPAVVLFLLAGLLLMFVSGKRADAAGAADSDTA